MLDLTDVFITSVSRKDGTSLCALELLAYTSALCVAQLEALSGLRVGGFCVDVFFWKALELLQ